jgi:hypothetical protein
MLKEDKAESKNKGLGHSTASQRRSGKEQQIQG